MPKSKFFRVAVEGATATDGRVIERSWIDDIVATYNPRTYGARGNLEHIKGYSPQPPFNAYCDVLAVKARDEVFQIGGKAETRRALYAQVDATDALVALNEARQKIYPSIEVTPNFANTGKAYLVGLAFTDSPASIGTEMLQFSAQNEAIKAMFNARKSAPENIICASTEAVFELEDASDDNGIVAGFKAALQALGFTAAPTPPSPVNDNKPAAPATSPAANDGQFAMLQGAMIALAANVDQAIKASGQPIATLEQRFTALEAKLDTTERPPAGGGRAPASGASTFSTIDC